MNSVMKDHLPRDDYEYLRREIPDRIRRDLHTAEDYYEYMQARVSRRSVLKGIGAGLAVAAAGPNLWSKPGYAAEPPQGIHVAYGSDPLTQMSVSWFTAAAVSAPVLDVGTDASYGTTIPAQSTTYPMRAGSDGQISVQHHVTIVGLKPATTYHYRLRHAGGASEDLTFTTANDKIEPFRFTAYGDQGIDPRSNATYATAGTKHSSIGVGAITALAPAFHLLAGDISYASGLQDIWDVWQRDVEPSASQIPWMVGLGNHEIEVGFGPQGYNPFRSRFRLPSNGIDWTPERTSTFYAFQHGSVLCVMLDGNEAASEAGYTFNRGYLKGKQDAWLIATLSAARANPTIDWIVVGFHNCMYCTDAVHGSDGGCRARWQKIFEDYHVDVVFNGHNHTYERAYPIKGTTHTTVLPGQPVDPTIMGVTYLCVGGGGQTPRAAPTYPTGIFFNEESERQFEAAPWRARRFEGYSVAVFDVDPGQPGGKTTLKLSVREFGTPALGEIDGLVLERPAKAILAGRLGGTIAPPVSVPPPPPRPRRPAQVKGVKELPATGVGEQVATGVAALATAAALSKALTGVGPDSV